MEPTAMNDTEINGMAQGIMMYLQQQCDPIDCLAVLICLILLYYERAKQPDVNFTIEEFAEQFSRDIAHHWKTRSIPVEGTDTVQ